MEFAAFALIAFAPGAFWLWFFLRKDVYRPEPKRLLAATFFLGVASAVPAIAVEYILIADSDFESMAFGALAANMLFIVGPVEEFSKFLAVRLWAYRSLHFDEPGDGLVYAAAASLGFASIENLLYVLEFGPAVMIVRAPISTVAHVVFGGFWGYALGRSAGGTRGGFWIVAGGLLAASAAHGMFNVVAGALPLAAIALVALGVWWTLSRFDWARRVSPFRYRRNYPKIACAACGRGVSAISQFCRFCGARVERRAGSALICGRCGAPSRPDASFCPACGDKFIAR